MGITMWKATCCDMSSCLPDADDSQGGIVQELVICADAPTVLMVKVVPESDARSGRRRRNSDFKSRYLNLERQDAYSELCFNVSIADPVHDRSFVTLNMKFTKSGEMEDLERTLLLPTGDLSGSTESSLFCTSDTDI